MSNTKKYGIKYLNLKKYLDNQIYLNNKGGANLLITGDSYRERLRQIDEDELDISDTPTYLSGFDKTRTNTDMNKLNNLMDSQLKKAESLQQDINTVNKKEYLYNLEHNTQVDHAKLQQDMEDLDRDATNMSKLLNSNKLQSFEQPNKKLQSPEQSEQTKNRFKSPEQTKRQLPEQSKPTNDRLQLPEQSEQTNNRFKSPEQSKPTNDRLQLPEQSETTNNRLQLSKNSNVIRLGLQ